MFHGAYHAVRRADNAQALPARLCLSGTTCPPPSAPGCLPSSAVRHYPSRQRYNGGALYGQPRGIAAEKTPQIPPHRPDRAPSARPCCRQIWRPETGEVSFSVPFRVMYAASSAIPHAPPSPAVAMTLTGVFVAAAMIRLPTSRVLKNPPCPRISSTRTPSSSVMMFNPVRIAPRAEKRWVLMKFGRVKRPAGSRTKRGTSLGESGDVFPGNITV